MTPKALASLLGVWSSGTGSLRRKLTLALMQSVRQGELAPGARLPSERALAKALAISRTTVVAAYDALREAGWFESRHGSGTWVRPGSPAVAIARGAAQAAALSANPLLSLLVDREADDVVDLGLGSPLPLDGLPPDAFVLPPDEYHALMRERLHYPLGLPVLRRAIAERYTREGLPTRPEQVLVTNGAQHAIALCAALFLQRGDRALIEDPTYFGAIAAFRTAGARMTTLPVGTGGVTPAVLRERMRATAARLVYLTPSCQNPTGAVTSAAACKEIARIAKETGTPVIDDRTLADLVLAGTPGDGRGIRLEDGPDSDTADGGTTKGSVGHVLSGPPTRLRVGVGSPRVKTGTAGPLAAYAPQAPIVTIGSLGKLIGPSLRIGWIRAPESLLQRLARLKTAMDLGSPLIAQAIAARLLALGDQPRKLRQRELVAKRDYMVRLLRARLPDWKFSLPAGGLFLWVRLGDGHAREFAQVAQRHGVVVVPGPHMSPDEQHADGIRITYLWDEATLKAGVTRLAAAWRQYRATKPRPAAPTVMI